MGMMLDVADEYGIRERLLGGWYDWGDEIPFLGEAVPGGAAMMSWEA